MHSRTDWIATDLDGTLFMREHCEGDYPGTWRPAEGNAEPQPSSWVPARRHRLLVHLAAEFRIIPVTARDEGSFARVRIDAVPMRDGAVLANGAILLKPGTMEPDPEWDAIMEPQLAKWAGMLEEMGRVLIQESGGNVTPRLVASHTPHPAYLVAKATHGFWDEMAGLRLRAALEPFECRVAALGRELQVLPPPVSKQAGLLGFARAYCGGIAPLLALGDMPEDLGFLREAEFLAVPKDSTLARRWCDGV